MREVLIVSGVRTAIGNFGGSLKDFPIVKLGAITIREVLKRAGLKPITGRGILDVAPDALKWTGKTVMEKPYDQWDD